MSTSVVELVQATTGYGEKPVLSSLTLQIEKGELIIIEGVTGSGKTTLIKLLLGAMPLLSGYGSVAGIELRGAGGNSLTTLRRRCGVVFQHPRFLDQESVLDNVSLPLVISGFSTSRSRAEGTRALLDAGLAAAARKRPSELSGGEQARAQIARSLVHRPILLLADEPFAHLDPDSANESEHLLRLAHARGLTVIVTTHRTTALTDIARRHMLADGCLK